MTAGRVGGRVEEDVVLLDLEGEEEVDWPQTYERTMYGFC